MKRAFIFSISAMSLAWLATASASAAGPSDVSVAATLGQTSAVLGDALHYAIRVSAPPGTRTTVAGLAGAFERAGLETLGTTATVAQALSALPATTGTSAGPVLLAAAELAPSSEHTARAGEAEVTDRVWKAAAFRLGTVRLEGAEVQYRLPDGSTGIRPVPPVELLVEQVKLLGNVKPPEGELFGVKPPLFIAMERRRRLWLAAAILLLGFLVSLAIWRPELLKRLLGLGPRPPPPPRPPDVVALDALDRLAAERLLDRGLVREYFGRLSEILRGYIDARFGLRSLEATTDEVTPVLAIHPVLGGRWLEPLKQVLSVADLAKFARHVPPRTLSDDLTGSVRTLVRETRPVEEPREGAGAAAENAREVSQA